MKSILLSALQALLLVLASTTANAQQYRVGEVVTNFTLIDRATQQPVSLHDFAGKIVVLDWFAWWCPFCQAAAPQLLDGIDHWYETRGGNPQGVPVVHIGVNLQSGQESQTGNFVQRAGLERVLQDFNRAVARRFASSGQPIFAIINGVTNAVGHQPWELLYSQLGYGETSFPIADFRAAIDSVRPAPTPAFVRIVEPRLTASGGFSFEVEGDMPGTLRIETTTNFVDWTEHTAGSISMAGGKTRIEFPAGPTGSFFRVVRR
jgi:thiol-disulfide isomerase/thioredoxin